MAARKPAPKILSRDEILEKDDLETVVVDVPEWGGALKIRELERQEILDCGKNAEAEQDAGGSYGDALDMHLMIAACVEPAFQPADIGRLRKKNARALQRVIEQINQLNNGGKDAVEGVLKSD